MQNLNWSQLLFNGSLIVIVICASIQWILNTKPLKEYFDKTDLLSAWMVYVPFGRTALYFTNKETYNTVKKYLLLLIPYVLLIGIFLFGYLNNMTIALLCAALFVVYAVEMSTMRDRFFKEHDLHMLNPVLFTIIVIAGITLVIGFVMRVFQR